MAANPLGLIAGADSYGLSPMPWSFDGITGAVVPSSQRPGAQAYRALITPTELTYPGGPVQFFGQDFFERIHYSWLLQDLGNVIGAQSVVLSVWNAFRRSERLLAFTGTGAEGITASGGTPVVPFDYPALREFDYTFTVTTEGPANIEASFAFDWQTRDGLVRLVGSRITAWSFAPDWTNGVSERLEWKTDVMQAYNGKEQRRALRLAPRKVYEFEAFFAGADRRYADSVIFGWGARVWAMPVWPDGQALAGTLGAGATEIMLDTATRDFAADSLVVILNGARAFEVIEVLSVAADRIVLKRPTASAWPAGAVVYPARTARMQDSLAIPRWTGDAAGLRVVFDVVEPVDYAASAGADTFRGYPVITRRPDWSAGFDYGLARKLASLDNLVGPRLYEDEAGIPIVSQRIRWVLSSRTEIDQLRRLLYALRGRHGAGWFPTWADDLVPAAVISNTATAIDVEAVNYVRQVNTATGRRDVRIELTDGTIYYRRITSASVVSASVERLTIDAALGRTVQVAEVLQISFMALVRLDSDAVDLAYWTGDVAEVATVLKGFQHDV